MLNPIFKAIAAISIDGKIARHSNHFSDWTSKEDKYFLHEMLDAADVIIVGNMTYKLAVGPLSKRNCIVLTRSIVGMRQANPNLLYYNPETQPLLEIVKKMSYKIVCVLGGTQVYSYCLENNLLDELFLTIEPVIFGTGLPLFDVEQQSQWKLKDYKKLNDSGTMLLHYVTQ